MTSRRKFLFSLIAAVATAPVLARLVPPEPREDSELAKFQEWIVKFASSSDSKLVLMGPKAFKVLTAFGDVNFIPHPLFKA